MHLKINERLGKDFSMFDGEIRRPVHVMLKEGK